MAPEVGLVISRSYTGRPMRGHRASIHRMPVARQQPVPALFVPAV